MEKGCVIVDSNMNVVVLRELSGLPVDDEKEGLWFRHTPR